MTGYLVELEDQNHVNSESPVKSYSFSHQRMYMEINYLTHQVIGCAFKVHNVLGFGFLEKVYENALRIELEKLGMRVLQQEKLNVWYEGQLVGDYTPDLWLPDN